MEDPLQIISSLYSLVAVLKVKYDCHGLVFKVGSRQEEYFGFENLSAPFLFSGFYFQNDISKHNSSVAMKN